MVEISRLDSLMEDLKIRAEAERLRAAIRNADKLIPHPNFTDEELKKHTPLYWVKDEKFNFVAIINRRVVHKIYEFYGYNDYCDVGRDLMVKAGIAMSEKVFLMAMPRGEVWRERMEKVGEDIGKSIIELQEYNNEHG